MLDFITPRETVVLTTRGAYSHMGSNKVRDNCAPIDWHMPVSPGYFAISVSQNSMSCALIDASRVFVVNFVSSEFADTVVKIGSVSGKTHDKCKEFGVVLDEAEGVDCGYLHNAIAYVSCAVEERIEKDGYVLYVGKVIQHRELKVGKRLFHVAENRFTTTKDEKRLF
jgi:flavin reductase (DIM6/NTAB) family NADH-FMN oxidoreductase RutF